MISIKDVARRAAVSPATVSRVINGASNVAPAIVARVNAAIEELGYFPNNAARSLVRRRSGAIAVLMRNLHRPFFINLIKGFESAAAESRRNVIFCSLGQEPGFRDRNIRFLTNGIADAVVLYGTLFSDRSIIEHLNSVHFPFLLVENNFDNIPVNQILIDNFGGASEAVEHLIRAGHRRIMHFMGDPNRRVVMERFNGYTAAMQRNGLSIEQDYIQNVHTEPDNAFGMAREVMARPVPERPTAIFATNDSIAAKTIQGIQAAGFSVPADISVVGFDDQRVFEDYNGPPITSIRQPLFEIGRDSIEIVTGLLEGARQAPVSKTYKTELVVRDTVGPPPAQWTMDNGQ